MNRDMLAGKWMQIKGSIKQKWGKLTDDEVDRIEGSWDKLVGLIHEHYGVERAEAEKQLDQYLDQLEKELAEV
jgi:uncharacterized protein YjbJ (UPF0337 family)